MLDVHGDGGNADRLEHTAHSILCSAAQLNETCEYVICLPVTYLLHSNGKEWNYMQPADRTMVKGRKKQRKKRKEIRSDTERKK
jgi:hypothetical protein